MDLILWRHAEAEGVAAGQPDLQRALTPRGEQQAARMARWLERQLPAGTRILSSPALRCEQTVFALGRSYQLREGLAPDAGPAALLREARWPGARRAMLVVGHQPTLGQAVAQLLGFESGSCSIRKGAVWWLRSRDRDGRQQPLVLAVRAPDLR